MNDEYKVAAVILAAGGSSRMGSLKQLLPVQQQSLIRRTVDIALEAHCLPVVVLGAYADQILPEIKDKAVRVVHNPHWQQGMGTSVSAGIQQLMAEENPAQAALIMLCDQPLVTASLLQQMIEVHHSSGKPVVACRYKDTWGAPALFHQHFFSLLAALQGDAGARSIIRQHISQVASVPFEDGRIDLDSQEDYRHFIQNTD